MAKYSKIRFMKENLQQENKAYWLGRAKGYSEVNKEELAGVQRENWTSFLSGMIMKNYPDKRPEEIRILDVGAGPGFISIILAEAGFSVTAVDFAETMLQEARVNAGAVAEKITFVQSDALNLPFDKEVFDVVFSRNLMWNIQFPDKAYEEWLRVLKPGGLLLVFDANWYTYLVDEQKQTEFQQDRQNVAEADLEDYNIGENFDVMEAIAYEMPSTRRHRPQWDKEFLEGIKAGTVETVEDVGSLLYSEKEKINYKSTPMFMVKLVKG